MFEKFFSTYSLLEPPKIYQDNSQLTINDIEMPDNTPYSISVENEDFENDSEITNPFIKFFQQNKDFGSNSNFIKSSENKVKKKSQIVSLKGTKAFEEAFQEAVKINPEVIQYKNFLVKTARRESNFNSYIKNTTGAPYYGYFQMGSREIKATTGLSVEAFRNNPVQQILGAVKLYKMNLKTIKALGIYKLGKEKGYSDDALVAGAWMGGPGGVKKYLLDQGDPSDSHWYKKANLKGGSSVGKIMNNWRKNE